MRLEEGRNTDTGELGTRSHLQSHKTALCQKMRKPSMQAVRGEGMVAQTYNPSTREAQAERSAASLQRAKAISKGPN